MGGDTKKKKDTNQGQEELTQLLFSLLVSFDFPHTPAAGALNYISSVQFSMDFLLGAVKN